MPDETQARKGEHIDICLDLDTKIEFSMKTTWFEYVELIHEALPELDLQDISLKTKFLGREFQLPIIIEGMTGGTAKAYEINRNLAEAAEKLGIPFGLGSQRAALDNPDLKDTYKIARETAPNVFLIGNLSGVQLAKEGVSAAEKAVEMIEADALAIHLNGLQELVQPEGTTTFRGILESIRKTAEKLSVPVIVKEVGAGISGETAKKLAKAGVKAIDIAGAGGTNWVKIELERARGKDPQKFSLGEVFIEWGIPTAASLLEVSSAVGDVEIIASGGIRNGLQVAKALALGADMVGMAKPLLRPAIQSPEAVMIFLNDIAEQLKAAMFLTGSRTINDLKKADYVLLGPLLEWIRQRLKKL